MNLRHANWRSITFEVTRTRYYSTQAKIRNDKAVEIAPINHLASIEDDPQTPTIPKQNLTKGKDKIYPQIKLTKQDVKKYYTLLKASEYSLSLPEDFKLKKSLDLWNRKTSKQQDLIKSNFENIVHDILAKSNTFTSHFKDAIAPEEGENARENAETHEKDEIKRNKDVNQSQGVPKFRYNLTSGTLSLKFPMPDRRVKNYFKFLELKKLRNEHNGLTFIEFNKELNKLDIKWRKLNGDIRNELKEQYENLLLKGNDINDDLTKIIPIISKHGDKAITEISYEPEPVLDPGKNHKRKVPALKFIVNEMTGFTYVFGLTYFHVWNYYLSREINNKKQSATDINLSQLIKKCKANWIKINSETRSKIFDEYKRLLASGKDMLNGEISSIEAKMKLINNYKTYSVIKVRGTTYEYDEKYIESQWKDVPEMTFSQLTNKFFIKQPSSLRFLKNQMTGKNLIIGELTLLHAYNYFIFENFKSFVEGENKVSFLHVIIGKWKAMSDEARNDYKLKYKQLLESGYDIYLGENMSIESKSEINNFKNVSVEVWGQLPPSYNLSGKKQNIKPPSIIIDHNSKKVKLVEPLNDVHIFNYFLTQNSTDQNISNLQDQWLKMSDQEKQRLADEYKNLLVSGYDYLYGKLISINEELPKLQELKNPNGKGTKRYQILMKEKPIVDSKIENDEEIFKYYQQLRMEESNDNSDEFFKRIEKDWKILSETEKNDINVAYELYKNFAFNR
ncbi:uncharacterized protein KGF55_002960 [Candida pseudojiufengensis]|uniref:uncharacterized protein n=1 Tax=Candida pseudojiufengensis TaxID=497109 RepID=UPI002224F05A|nr:uncharacterized protein KGF55_002960 [Candida pseudojiufengensis]KAI5963168.1 hypothetical protein KGF55_002960 [Candida pseudojiufengensis]